MLKGRVTLHIHRWLLSWKLVKHYQESVVIDLMTRKKMEEENIMGGRHFLHIFCEFVLCMRGNSRN
ncbi:hypothetical protein KY290_033133 [Solanum tuberosum]|uniref:Uncharacterized protein n=1 Tax=Solanum tuberosum TaxID=4113 RepID=A0ABQ7U324_SOLTU|nr:hypothetical protein KY284_032123 [Solanum tuberosum]KAH0647133.1 hypothetical protein KY285_032381 [Solanum tuberosum]KAH0740090.1 hypothetical protein KY290_033133 [Solanum tuberosum]